MIVDWYSAVGKNNFYITLTNDGLENKPLFYSDNAKIVSHWIEWSSIFVRPEPQNFVVKIGSGQALTNPMYFTQMQSILNEIFNIKERLERIEGWEDNQSYKLQIAHSWGESPLKTDIMREFRNTAHIYKGKKILFTLNVQIDLLLVEAKGLDYKELREFFKENVNNGIYNIVTLKNLQYAGEETKKMLNILSGFWKFNHIMGVDLVLNESNHSNNKAVNAELLQFYKYLKMFCPKGFMEMILGDFMDLQRAIKDGPAKQSKHDLKISIMAQIDAAIKSGVVINAGTSLVSPIFSPEADDYRVIEGFHHSELKDLTFVDVKSKFRAEIVKKVLASPCAKCSSFDVCVKQKIWWLNIPKNTSGGCKLGLQHYIKHS